MTDAATEGREPPRPGDADHAPADAQAADAQAATGAGAAAGVEPGADGPPAEAPPEGPPAAAGPEVGAAPAAPPWEPPETFADVFSRWSIRAIRGALALLGLVSLGLLILWGVPTAVVTRSAPYRAAAARAEADPFLAQHLGAPLRAARLPERWVLEGPAGGRFRFEVAGPRRGRAVVEARVEGGEVTGFHVTMLESWGY